MSDDYQQRRCEALRSALNEVLRITLRFKNGDGTYHNVVNDVYSVACRALNADAEMGPRGERVSLGLPKEGA